MKRIFFLFLFTLSKQISFSQKPSYFLVGIKIESTSLLNDAQNLSYKELIVKRLTNTFNNIEGVIIDESAEYFITVDAYVSQTQKSNAGILPIISYKMTLNIKLKQKSVEKSFKALNYSQDYAVNSESEALQLLTNGFNFSAGELNDFFSEGFNKMKKYYSENCNSLIESVKKYENTGEPQKGLAICFSIPMEVPCYKNVESLIKPLYTSLSFKSDYNIFLRAQNYVSRGDYDSAYSKLAEISIHSQFYSKSQKLIQQINDFHFNQKELTKKKELAESEQKLKLAETALQQKKNELQESINQANIEIARQKNESNLEISRQEQANQRSIRNMELHSEERKEMIKSARDLLNLYISNRRFSDNNIYIIK